MREKKIVDKPTNFRPELYKYGSCDDCEQEGDSLYMKRVRKVMAVFKDDFANMDQFVDGVHRMRNDLFHANQRKTVDAKLRDGITHDLYFLIRVILLNETGLGLTVDSYQRRVGFSFLERKGQIG